MHKLIGPQFLKIKPRHFVTINDHFFSLWLSNSNLAGKCYRKLFDLVGDTAVGVVLFILYLF